MSDACPGLLSERRSGILLHITSLASAFGSGSMGASAREFIDFLVEAGQSYWQILPLGPTGFGDSPYQTFSTHAGNPYLVDIDTLIEEGFLKREEAESFNFASDPEKLDYYQLWRHRTDLLRIAERRLNEDYLKDIRHEFDIFREEESASWLSDYSLFMSIKNTYKGAPCMDWPDELRLRNPQSLKEFSENHQADINFHEFVQFLFFRQWEKLHEYACNSGIKIIGDMPIYVAEDSVEFWTQPQLFQVDKNLRPLFVAGTPPDDFSAEGQLWGSPLYNWEAHGAQAYKWWIERIGFQMRFYDLIRLDHFRGFESYWAIPYGDQTAENGRWLKGPADKLFDAVKDELGEIPIFAEDLGHITEEVKEFLNRRGLPGMKVLQFAFDPEDQSAYLPHNLSKNSVLYTGTHDNDTIKGWLEDSSAETINFAKNYLGLNAEEGYVWGMMRGAATTVANTLILQMQDLLELGSEARMNLPASLSGNWQWRMKPGVLSHELADKLYELTRISGRLK